MEIDFIGEKYITGRSEPIDFIGFAFKKEPKLRYFKRIEGQTSKNFIKHTDEFFKKFEKPDFAKVDNALAMIGSASGKRNISKSMQHLLKDQVIPIFAVPRKPFSQASIEGNNSVFARKFWNKINFKSVKEIDKKIEWFNSDSASYHLAYSLYVQISSDAAFKSPLSQQIRTILIFPPLQIASHLL